MSTQKNVIYDRHGNIVEGGIVPDGGKMRVPHLLMDAAPAASIDAARKALADSTPDTARHSPGGLALSDADLDSKARALDARDKRVSEMWKHPPATPDVKKDAATIPAVTDADLDALHARRNARLEGSWKGAAA